MKIENGIGSKFLNPDHLEMLNDDFNASHPGLDVTVSVNLNWSEPEGGELLDNEEETTGDDQAAKEPPAKEPYLRYALGYKHPLAPKEKVWITSDQRDGQIDVKKGILTVIDIYLKQTQSCEHSFVREKDAFGKEFPDGRAICTHCELAIPDVMPKIPGMSVISMSCTQDVVAQHNWGSAYVQGGGSGLVLSKKGNYTTAFVEAFPNINGFGTFLRGEGESVLAAEQACWDSYQRKLNCPGHEWSREVHGHHRTDGYARCIHCGLCTSDALKPETVCKVCQAPTTKQIGEEFVCLTHYYETPEDERAAAYVKMMTDHRDSDSGKAQYDFDYRFLERLQAYAFGQMGEERYLAAKSQLRSVLGVVKHNFYVLMLDAHPLKAGYNYDEASYAKMAQCHAHIMQNWSFFLKFLDESAENRKVESAERKELRGVTLADMIPAQYLPKDSEPA